MRKAKTVFQNGTRWFPGRESNLSFWFDSWTSQGPLRQVVQGPLPLESEKMKIRDVVDESGWKWDLIPFDLPLNYRKEIQAIPFALTTRSQDRLVWVGTKHGDFDLHSAYRLAKNLGSVEPFHGKWVWYLKILPRIQFFLWKCCHNSVRVREA